MIKICHLLGHAKFSLLQHKILTLIPKMKLDYILHLADNALILGHRLSEWCGHGPVLEQDMAMTNIALDLVGQSRNLFQLAAEIDGQSKEEDHYAYFRDAIEFKNLLLVEQENGDFAKTVLRQFFYDAFNFHLYNHLLKSKEKDIAAIAEKSLKEITYHLRWSAEWVIRLGDGTEESKSRIEKALVELWPYTGEMFIPAEYEKEAAEEGYGINPESLKKDWDKEIAHVFAEAKINIPEEGWMHKGGKKGVHTEKLGFLLAEMQFLQRAYPGQKW